MPCILPQTSSGLHQPFLNLYYSRLPNTSPKTDGLSNTEQMPHRWKHGDFVSCGHHDVICRNGCSCFANALAFLNKTTVPYAKDQPATAPSRADDQRLGDSLAESMPRKLKSLSTSWQAIIAAGLHFDSSIDKRKAGNPTHAWMKLMYETHALISKWKAS